MSVALEKPMPEGLAAKLSTLIRAAGRSPRDTVRWLQHLPCWHRSLMTLELPWFSYGAIRFLDAWLKPHHAVFEYGGGGSSVFLARRAGEVLTMESDLSWHAEIERAAAERGLRNIRCEYFDLGDHNAAQFRDNPFFHRIRGRRWDVVVIDCYCGFATSPTGLLRPYAFELAREFLAPNGIIVLDDYWMFPELLHPCEEFQLHLFRGLGPCNYGIKTTAIFEAR